MNIEDVVEIYTKFSSDNEKDFLEAEKLKNEVILHKQNIWVLMQNMINPEFDPSLQLFISCLINDILNSHFKSLPLYEIMDILSLVLSESIEEQRELNESIINSIYDMIGMLKFYIYVIDGRFLFNYEKIEEKTQYFEFLCFFKYFNSPPNYITDLFEEKEIVKLFINTQFHPLLQYLFQQIENLTNEPIQILNQCIIILLIQENKKADINSEFSQFFIDLLNDSLKTIYSNFEKFTSFHIIDLLSSILNFLNLNDDVSNHEIFEGVFTILSNILDNSEIYLIEEISINSFNNLMMNFPSYEKILDHCENYCSSFLNFIHKTLQNNYFLSLRILSSSTEFLYNIYDYIPASTEANFLYLSLFEKFFIETSKSIEEDPILTFNSLFDGIDELKTTKKIIISLLQSSESKIDDNIELIVYNFNEIKKDQSKFSLVYDVKMSFIYYVSIIIIKYDFFESGKKSDQNLTNFLFSEFSESFERLDDYKNNEDMAQLNASERMVIEFLRIYVKKYIFNNNTTELCPIIPLSAFDNINLLINFIFSRLWKDMKIDLQLKQAGEVMSFLLNSRNFVEVLTTTNCYQDFYDYFLSYPTKYIIYKTISKVTIAQNLHIEFIQKVYDCFFERFDEVSVLKFFKLLASFFQNATTSEIWSEIYDTFQSKFESECEAVSNIADNKIQKFFLKFLVIFIQSFQIAEKDVEKEVHSYKLMIIQLLLNLENNILNNITENEKENADFDHGRWINIELLIQTFSLCIQSLCSNLDLIFSERENIFQFYSQLILIISNTSFSSFLSHPLLVLNLSGLLKIFAQYFKEDLRENDQFWDFYITSSKLILLNSNCTDSINLISQSLCYLLNDYSISLRNHFALAFDILSKKDDLFLTVEFLILFFKVDEKFVFNLGKLIEDDLDDDDLKHDFNQNYLSIWQYVTDNEDKISRHEIIHHIYHIILEIQIKWHNLDCLEKCFVI